jgi:hypothetical protein
LIFEPNFFVLDEPVENPNYRALYVSDLAASRPKKGSPAGGKGQSVYGCEEAMNKISAYGYVY